VHAKTAIAELGRFAGAGADERTDQSDRSDPSNRQTPRFSAWHTCFAGQLAVLTDPQALHGTVTTVAAAAERLAQLGDAIGEAKAHLVHALALSRLGKIGAREAALDQALAALWGPSPVTRASGRCLDVVRVLRITQGAPAVEAVALRSQAVLEALRGRAEAARCMIESSRRGPARRGHRRAGAGDRAVGPQGRYGVRQAHPPRRPGGGATSSGPR